MCDELNPDLLVVTEHGYNNSSIQHFKIQNYQLASYYCRTSAKGGGVAVFVKENFSFTPYTLTDCSDKNFEVAGVKISTSILQLIVIGIYRSPSGNEESFLAKFEKLLTEVTGRKDGFIVLGDFNVDILNVESPLTQRLTDLVRTFGVDWSINSPTRVTNHSATAIDNVLTNITDVTVSVINTAVSDHYGQLATISGLELTRDPLNKKTIRDTKPSNIELLNSLLSRERWSFFNFGDPVDVQFQNFEQTFNFYLNMSCPLKKIQLKPRKETCKWITKGILVSREKLFSLSEINRRTSNENFKKFFKNYRRTYRKVIKAAKAYDVAKSLLSSKNVSKTAWAIINKNKALHGKQIELQVGNEQVSDPFRVADEFNRFFASVGATQGPGPPNSRPLLFSVPSPAASMSLMPVTEEEIAKIIREFQPKKSNDLNHLSMWLLKQCSSYLLKPLEHLINLSFASGHFPSALKKAKVTPIFKKGSPFSIENYRPISILPVLSKVFEKVFLNRIVRFLEKHKVLSTNQFGFQSGKSTTDAVVRLVDMMVEGMEGRERTLSVFLDLSKAFDCVDHSILTHKLEHYGIRGVPLKWLKSYLRDRTQFVGISDARSKEVSLGCGVPQGSILSPLLFLIYVNDVGASVHKGRIVQYADDTTLCFNANSDKELEKMAFIELNSVIQHFQELNLRTNPDKSSFVPFRLRQTDSDQGLTVMVDETEIKEVYSTKFLGIHLDRGLTWDCHVDSVCSKLASGIYVLRQLSKYCPTQVLMTAYYGLIYPHLSYGLALWGGCTSTNFSRAFILQKQAVRIIAKLQRRESCRPAFKSLQLLTLPCLYILETCLFFKLKCEIIRGSDIHSYATRGRDNYRTGRHRTVVHERLPSQAGVQFVNRLPNSIKCATPVKSFKARLKAVLITKAFYNTEEYMAHNWEAC